MGFFCGSSFLEYNKTMGYGINFDKIPRGKNKEKNYIKQEIMDSDLREYRSYFYDTLREGIDEKYQKDANFKKVEGYFDSEKELSEILKIEPGTKKDEALGIFKLKLAEQQKGLALLKESLFETINDNESNDKLRFSLENIMYEYSDEYKFSPYQKDCIKDLIAEFLKRNKAVNNFWKENNGDPVKMYKEIFKIQPNGKVEVKMGPMSTTFICSDLVDYARLYNGDYSGNSYKEVESKTIENARKSGGVFTQGAPEDRPDLRYSIIGVKELWCMAEVIKHEEQHAIDRVYANNIESVNLKNLELSLYFCKNATEAEKLAIAFCKDKIIGAGENAKDEILAYKTDEYEDSEEILAKLTKTRLEGGLYDYVDQKELLESIVLNLMRFKDDREEIYQEAKRVIIDKYRELIEKGICAVDILRRKGYGEQGIVAVLMPQELGKWGKIANRMPLMSKDNKVSFK